MDSISRTTDDQRGNSLQCTADNSLPPPNIMSATQHKGLKSLKRFTNLPLGSMSSTLYQNSLMHQYGSLGILRTKKIINALIEVFKFIHVERNKMHFCSYSRISEKSLHRVACFSDVGLNCESQGEHQITFKIFSATSSSNGSLTLINAGFLVC